MSNAPTPRRFYIGWDVGGWNCDKNPSSRDAIVILDDALTIVGRPWRGNLRKHINAATNTRDWVVALFTLCGATLATAPSTITLAIDAPLGYSEEFVQLVTSLKSAVPVERSNTNPYLFRRTERWLYEQGLSPLSAVKDMIGSQATKGMHVLARFARIVKSCGVWTDGAMLTAIEAYPAACSRSAALGLLRTRLPVLTHDDLDDALCCALVAHLYATDPSTLVAPGDDVPSIEGWIWLPTDAVPPVRQDANEVAQTGVAGIVKEVE
jgi:Protein of unknown function (DUF429)